MKPTRTIGWLFILASVALFVPYTLLTLTFDYPDILRQAPGEVLQRFHAGGPALVYTWWAFAMVGLPLLPAYTGLGQLLQPRFFWMRTATALAVTGGIVQVIGLLRWTFVVPVVAARYVAAPDEAARRAQEGIFEAVHQYGGVILGEHLGQLFSIAWTIYLSLALWRAGFFAKGLHILGLAASAIYLLAQGELFATVVPGFPVWDLAGFLGSTLWLIWLLALGIALVRKGGRYFPLTLPAAHPAP